ncbi:MAG: hypothetical protein LQ348_007107 [Seirophora lacunosa]|nr:MAG: hypothetical protein LQ348_007107 [Seirophora lacunosa]
MTRNQSLRHIATDLLSFRQIERPNSNPWFMELGNGTGMPIFSILTRSIPAPDNVTQETPQSDCNGHCWKLELGLFFLFVLIIVGIGICKALSGPRIPRAAVASIAEDQRAQSDQQGVQEVTRLREQARDRSNAVQQRRREARLQDMRDQQGITTRAVRDISDRHTELNRRLADLQRRLALTLDQREPEPVILQTLDPARIRGRAALESSRTTGGDGWIEGESYEDGPQQGYADFEQLPAPRSVYQGSLWREQFHPPTDAVQAVIRPGLDLAGILPYQPIPSFQDIPPLLSTPASTLQNSNNRPTSQSQLELPGNLTKHLLPSTMFAPGLHAVARPGSFSSGGVGRVGASSSSGSITSSSSGKGSSKGGSSSISKGHRNSIRGSSGAYVSAAIPSSKNNPLRFLNLRSDRKPPTTLPKKRQFLSFLDRPTRVPLSWPECASCETNTTLPALPPPRTTHAREDAPDFLILMIIFCMIFIALFVLLSRLYEYCFPQPSEGEGYDCDCDDDGVDEDICFQCLCHC